MSTERYIGRWGDWASMRDEFFERPYNYERKEYGAADVPDDFPPDEAVLFASYGGGSYEGDALVIFERAGQLFEVSGSHCSCYGLEGQWNPSETDRAALALRIGTRWFLDDHDGEAKSLFEELFGSPPAADAVDPHADSTGKLSTRDTV